MNLQETLERFSIIANLPMEDISPWIPICEDACDEIKRHLRSGVDEIKNARRLNVAAAALSFYKYVLYRASGGAMESFSAGELRIKTNGKMSIKMAHKVWEDAKSSIADLLTDDDFIFERII